jgi:N-acetylglucosaminyldiphosphoundecaprenol N-acetyl-beta-D-mannosaminyltransferase
MVTRKSKIFALYFQPVTLSEAANQVLIAAVERRKGLVVTPNVDHVVMLNEDKEMRRIYEDAILLYADGMPLVWLSKILPVDPLPERVTGADLLPLVCARSAGQRLRIYLLGGNPGVADRAAVEMTRQYPGLIVAGTYCPPFGFEHDPEETSKIVADINSRRVDILFIGVGAPKQEKWAAANLEELSVGPILCVGASFDFAAGVIKRAPAILQNAGLEWLWRLAMEPRRLWKRYLLRGIRFVPIVWQELHCQWRQK